VWLCGAGELEVSRRVTSVCDTQVTAAQANGARGPVKPCVAGEPRSLNCFEPASCGSVCGIRILQLHARGPPGHVRVNIRPAHAAAGSGGNNGLVIEVATKNVRRLEVGEVSLFVGHPGWLQLELDGTSVTMEGADTEVRGGVIAGDEAAGAPHGQEALSSRRGQPSTRAAPGGTGEPAFYCADSRGRGGELERRWQPCYAGAVDGRSDGSDATCGCCGVGERMAAAGAGPIRRVFSRPFVIVFGTGSSHLLHEFLGFAQVTSQWFTKRCACARVRAMWTYDEHVGRDPSRPAARRIPRL
jgi:hypothetical protein